MWDKQKCICAAAPFDRYSAIFPCGSRRAPVSQLIAKLPAITDTCNDDIIMTYIFSFIAVMLHYKFPAPEGRQTHNQNT